MLALRRLCCKKIVRACNKQEVVLLVAIRIFPCVSGVALVSSEYGTFLSTCIEREKGGKL